jgi:hypothetical protein
MDEAVHGFTPGVAIVGGPILPKPGAPRPFFSIAPEYRDEQGAYPTANVFYRREVALAAGGFDSSFGGNIAGRPVAGWDADLAWKVRRNGYRARFQRGAIVYNQIFVMRPVQWFADGTRAVTLPLSVKRVPELARFMLLHGLFMDRITMYFDLAAAGIGVALLKRHPLPLVAALPWVWWARSVMRHELHSPAGWPKFGAKASCIFVKQSIALGSLLVGSIRAKRLVL